MGNQQSWFHTEEWWTELACSTHQSVEATDCMESTSVPELQIGGGWKNIQGK